MSEKHLNNNHLPIIFIHGSFANAKSWRKIIELNNFQNNSQQINLPGHGGLDDPSDFNNPTFETEFNAIKAQTEYANNPVHLVGHSYGGVVSLAAALTKSFNVAKLTLFEPVAVSTMKTFKDINAVKIVKQFIEEYRFAAKDGEKNACSRVIDFWGGEGSFEMIPPHIQDAMASMTKNNLRHWDLCDKQFPAELYKNLDIPVDIIYGSKSNEVAKSIAKNLFENLPDARLHQIEGASHFMITSHPKECLNILFK
ncbi:MAG: alpha/beta hydrolase [Emcibacteraceae bacterium]|nr:alpha/beta hydrolase [Emcibacteraceae bacterium]